jgi:hypothetical protein
MDESDQDALRPHAHAASVDEQSQDGRQSLFGRRVQKRNGLNSNELSFY